MRRIARSRSRPRRATILTMGVPFVPVQSESSGGSAMRSKPLPAAATKRIGAVLFLLAGATLAFAAGESPAPPADDPSVLAAEIEPLANQALMLDVAQGTTRAIAVGERGEVLVSESRREWHQVENVPTRANLTAVTTVADQAWAVGHDGVILHSKDGGASWTRQRVAPYREDSDDPRNGAPLLDVLFLDEQHGFAIGAYSLMLRTTDGGATWEDVALPAGGEPVAAKSSAPSDESWTFDQEDLKVGEETDPHLNAITRTGDGSLLIVGERGSGFRSTDKGATWQKIRLPYEGSMFGVLGYEERHVLAFGLRGHALESFDLGSTWRELQTGVELSLMGGTALPQGGAVLVGANGVVLKRPSGSAAFERSTYETPGDKQTPVLSTIVPLAEDTYLVTGENGVDTYQLH
jgi:photosystem II stability/assembly factor-like uncharacterized protein